MFTVYFLRSINSPQHTYRGYTERETPEERLAEHNRKHNPSTALHAPWEIVAFISFKNEKAAREFERYTKHGSGHAFTQKHIFHH